MNAIWDRARTAFSERLTRNWSPHALPSRATAPVVSFSFDDFPRSAAREGAQILREFGVKGTYFVAGARAGKHLDEVDQFTKDDLLAVAEAGHEIGCHTFGHIRLPSASHAEITDDLLRNQEFVRQVLGDYTMCSFAYPDGDVSITTKALVGRWFPICRGIWGGVNHRRIDFMQLKAVSLGRSFDRGHVEKILDDARETNGWVIFFTHDISDNPSPYGCRPGQLAGMLQSAMDRGIEILPIKNAAGKMRFP
jgi:peptidoglycan/xylan/chitin deacetylase (PgdA/CDA1 family)